MAGTATLASPRSEATLAALDLFGTKGFEATSTREIAAAAGANIASIAYHFGGKEGLRLACADFVVETIESVLRGVLGAASDPAALDAGAARARLLETAAAMIDAIVMRREAEPIVRYVLSELASASP